MRFKISLAVAVLAMAAATACGSKSSPTNPSQAAPRVTGILPAQIIQAGAPQTITVNGLNFVSGLTVTIVDPSGTSRTFAGGEIQAFQNNSFQVTPTFGAPGTYTLTVKNTASEVSDPFSFSVQSQAGGTTPQITGLSPASTLHSANSQFVTINGSQFAPSLVVTLIDPTGQPTQLIGGTIGVVTPTQFQIVVTLSQIGTYTLFVTNPTGEVSNSVSLPVQ